MSTSDRDDRDSAADIHRRIKAEFDRLERERASRLEWINFANRIVEAVMACQKIVLEHQSRLFPQPGADTDTRDYQETRQASRDALQALDNLSTLYQRARLKLGS